MRKLLDSLPRPRLPILAIFPIFPFLAASPLGRNYVLSELYLPLYWLLDDFTNRDALDVLLLLH